MPIPQSNVAPLLSKPETLDIITLKNLVALDLVESNENLLRAFQLLDESKKRKKAISVGDKSLSTLKIKVEKLKTDNEKQSRALKRLLDDEKCKKKSLTTAFLEKLSLEFGKDFEKNDNLIIDDTQDLVEEFERANLVKVMFDESHIGVYTIREQEKTIIEPPCQPPAEAEQKQQQQQQPDSTHKEKQSQDSQQDLNNSSQATILSPSSQLQSGKLPPLSKETVANQVSETTATDSSATTTIATKVPQQSADTPSQEESTTSIQADSTPANLKNITGTNITVSTVESKPEPETKSVTVPTDLASSSTTVQATATDLSQVNTAGNKINESDVEMKDI